MRKIFGLIVFAGVVGCSAGGGTGGGSGGGSGVTLLTCFEVLQCVNNCGSADAGSCADGCVGRASSAATAQLQALVNCDQAQGCNSEDACLEMKCANEVNACLEHTDGGMTSGTGGGTGDGFPARYEGTVTDENPNFGGLQLKSVGQAVFVRDDSADPRGQSGMFAFYKLQSITYVATEMGTIGPCTMTASETVTFTNPSAFENLVAIQKQRDGQGAYAYDITTTLSAKRSGALTIACNPGGTSTANFNAENNVAAGVPGPTTSDLKVLKATAQGSNGGRIWSWDLKGMN
ncbi:MAG: hypothetical protein K1X64_21675 [Myxococcaceae bacterium]|nr:hypothetical protein [Myxococcaceae bacterium]